MREKERAQDSDKFASKIQDCIHWYCWAFLKLMVISSEILMSIHSQKGKRCQPNASQKNHPCWIAESRWQYGSGHLSETLKPSVCFRLVGKMKTTLAIEWQVMAASFICLWIIGAQEVGRRWWVGKKKSHGLKIFSEIVTCILTDSRTWKGFLSSHSFHYRRFHCHVTFDPGRKHPMFVSSIFQKQKQTVCSSNNNNNNQQLKKAKGFLFGNQVSGRLWAIASFGLALSFEKSLQCQGAENDVIPTDRPLEWS